MIYTTFAKHESEIMNACSLLHLRYASSEKGKRHLSGRKKEKLEQLFSPALIFQVSLAFYLVEHIPGIEKETGRIVKAVDDFLKGQESSVGKKYAYWLMNGEKNESKLQVLRTALLSAEHEFGTTHEEGSLYETMNIEANGLMTHQAIRCLEDMNGRTLPFMLALMEQVHPGMKICEIGVGTGILSLSALFAGAASVTGVEINPITCILAKRVIEHFEERNIIPSGAIKIHWADALTIGKTGGSSFSYAEYDLVISENIYTGMFYEKQVQLMNRVHSDKHVKARFPEQKIIPCGMTSYVEPVSLSESVSGKSHTALDLHMRGIRETALSKPYMYHHLDFTEHSSEYVTSRLQCKMERDGILDALLVFSRVEVTSLLSIERNENEFLNNDHIIQLYSPLSVYAGQVIEICMEYRAGSDVEGARLSVKIL